MTPPWRRLSTALYGPAIIVVLLGGLGSIGAAMMLRGHNDSRQAQALRHIADGTVSELRLRMQIYEYGLKGARGTIIGMGGQFSRERFRKYAESRDLVHEFPGALGYGFVRRVTPADEARFVDEARRDGAPEFTIRSFAPHPGDRFVIQYIEPERDNAPAVGLDVASEPLRRAAALAAVSTGASTLTAPIKLVQLQVDATGFLMFLPVYQDAEPASNASHREVIGWAYTALAITRILHVLDDRGECTMSIADVSFPGAPVVIFSSPGSPLGHDDSGSPLTVQSIVPMYGRSWRVEIHATQAFLTHLDLPSPWVLGTSIMVSAALLAGLIVTVQWSLRRQLRLSAERDRLAAIVQFSGDTIIATDLAGVITSWNASAERLLGYTATEMIGRPVVQLYRAERGEGPLLRDRPGEHDDTELVTKDGRAVNVSLTVSSIEDAHGAPVAWSIIARDTSERRRAEAVLRASEQRFRDLAESIPHQVWTCASDGPCEYISPQWGAYTGLPETAGLGYGWVEQIHPADIDDLQTRWTAAVVSGGVFHAQFRIRRADGVYRWFQTRATPIRDGAGRVVKWFGSNTDIQDLRDAEAVSARLTQDLEARVLARTDELRAANAQLASVARQLQVAQRITHVGSWECNIADNSWRWSEELFRILGLPPQQQVPAFSTLETMLMPESWAMLSAAMQHSIATGDGYELTLEIVRPGGEHRTAIARCEALRDATGAMEKLVGTIQDVTELARVRTELVTASERLQVATSAARLGVWEWNLRDNVVVWDDMMHSLYNTRREDWEGAYEAWLSGVHPDDLAMVKAELQAALAGTGEIHSEFRIVWKSGEVRYLHPVATVQRDPDTGKPLRVIGANWDVTEQRVAELALRKSEALQRGLLAHAGFAIIATDCTGTITLFNHAAEAMFGYTAAELVGGPIPPEMHDPEEINARREALERELGHPLESPLDVFVYKTAQRKSEAQEWTCFHRDGTPFPVLLTVGMLRDDAGEILGRLGVGVDLTSHKQHEAELVELNRLLAERSAQAESASHAKSMFLANMSHEIRTPMNAITGVTYLLNQTQLSPDQHDLVRTLQSGTKTLLGMINDILDLSKIEAGQLTLDEGPFRLSQVLDDLGAMMAALAADKRLELVIQTDDEAPEQLIGDAMRLTQILTNLVGNAIKFTDAGTVRLGVRVASTDDACTWLRFEVQDTGPGIAEPMLHRLFTPFTQVDQPGARRAGGTGLGLAIVKQLATLMRGEVGVESTPGTGSVFWCRIPFARVTDVHHVAWPLDLELLIVEPHTGQREVLASYARRCGWRVQEAGSNDDVVSMVHAQARAGRPFDAVVLDCNPPGLRGLLVLNAIRESTSLARQPAVVLTTLHDVAAVRAHHGAHRADVVIGKPITSSSLFNAVTEAVGAHGHPGEHTSDVVHANDHGHRLAGTRLLVVDDSKLNQIVVGRIMEREGAEVEIAGDGLQAVSRIQAAPGGFDAVLMDVQMPELDGIEATRRIRCISACAHLPIIAVTAGAMASERQLALAAGVNEVISKPFDPEVVVANVRKYIHQVRGRIGPVLLPVHRKAPPSDWPDWPAVDGIDANDVALRLDGDVEMFRSLLALFIGDLDELERTLSTPPSGEQVVQVAQRLHKLRGTAGNLGARDLYAVANDTEQALREERMPAAIEGLHRVLEQLARLRRSVTGLLDAHAPSATDATTGSSLDQARSTPIV